MPNENVVDEMVVKLVADASELVPEVKNALGDVVKTSKAMSVETGKNVGGVTSAVAKAKQVISTFGASGKAAFGIISNAAKVFTGSLGTVSAVIGAIKEAWKGITEAAIRTLDDVRLERKFAMLSGSISQTTQDMLDAMSDASDGAITHTEMLTQGVYALNAGLELTPELLGKLTEASLTLSKAFGENQSATFKELVDAISRADAGKLAAMGVSMADIYTNLDKIAQEDFGKPAAMLASYERDAAFAEAAINAVSDATDGMSESLGALATPTDQFAAGMEKIHKNSDEAKFVIHNLATKTWVELKNAFANTDMFKRNLELSNKWKDMVISDLSDVFAFIVTFSENAGKRLDAMWGFITGKKSFDELKNTFSETTLQKMLGNYATRAEQIEKAMHNAYDDLSKIDEAGKLTGADKPYNDIAAASQAYRKLGLKYAQSIQRYIQTLSTRERKLATDHQRKLGKITEDGLAARARAQQTYNDNLLSLAADVAKRRESILSSSYERQQKITKDYQVTSKRAEEDYQKSMRRLKEEYLYNLEDAVRERDARAIVELKRKYNLDKKHKTEDYQDTSSRRQQDYTRSLTELRAATDDQLAALSAYQQQKAAELEQARNDELARINDDVAEKTRIENEYYAQQTAELQAQLNDRLTTIAQGMADQNDVTEAGAKTILETLLKTFGLNGDIDKLMSAFVERRKNDMAVAYSLQEAFGFDLNGGGAPGSPRSQQALNRILQELSTANNDMIPGLATGGAFVARSPTLITVGEREPELVTAAPMRALSGLKNITGSSGSVNRVSIDFSGSAPPGILPQGRDEIARVVLSAIRDTGVLADGG